MKAQKLLPVLKKITKAGRRVWQFLITRRLFSLITLLSLITAVVEITLFLNKKPQQATAAWFNDSWMYRKKIEISYSGSSTLEEYQVLIDNLDTATLISAGKMQSDCDDIRFTDLEGRLLNYSIVGATCNTSDTEIWVKTWKIPSGGTTIYMYYGNPSAQSFQSESKTFSYRQERLVGYILDSSVNDLQVISLEDDNSITHNSTTLNLNKYETGSFTSISQFSPVYAKKLFNADDQSDDTDMIVPVSWAGTEFTFYSRYTSLTLFAIAPWQDATVDIYQAGNAACTGNSVTSSGTTINCTLPAAGQVKVSSNYPILVFAETNGGSYDQMPLHPTSTNKWIGGSMSTDIAASANGADYRYIRSSDTAEQNPADLGADTYTSIGGGSYGASPAFLIWSANYPIASHQMADSDGGDSHMYVLLNEMGTRYGSAVSNTDYISLASDQAATCTVYDTSGNQLGQTALSSSNSSVYWGGFGTGNSNSFTTSDWYMECDKPVAAHYQKGSGSESGLWTYPMLRQFTYPTPSVGSPGSEEKVPGPVAWWKFDEGYGTTAHDSTNNQINGTISGATWQTEDLCMIGKCLSFDGNDDYVSISSTVNEIKTVSFWVKPNTTTTSLLALNDSAYISVSSGTISATGFTSPTIYVNGKQSTTLVANQWQHIVVTTNTGITGSAITLGKASSSYLQGFLDEVKLYNYARSAAQIKADYNAGKAKVGSAKGAAVVMGSPEGGINLSEGLVGYWKMDEVSWTNDCSTSTVLDASGNGNHGKSCPASTGPTGGAAGKFGNGGSFDGGTSYVDIGDPPEYDFGGNDFSISAWAYRNSGWEDWDTVIVAKWNTGSSPSTNEWSLALGAATTGYDRYPSFTIESSTNKYKAISPDATNDNQWYHLVGVRNGNYIYLYVNGVEKAKTYVGNATVNNVSGRTVKIAKIDGGTYGLNGKADEVRIYNRALSPREVRALYEWSPGPIAHWKFDEKTGTTAYDTSGNSNNITLGTSSSAPSWANGKFGGALNFDGNNDYIETNSQSLNIGSLGSSGFTISAWHKKNATNQGIIDIAGDYDGNYWWLIWFSSNTTINFGVDDGSNNPKASATVTDDTSWHYVAGVWDANNHTAYLYWDGILVTSANTASFNPTNSTSPVRIGVGGSGRTTQFFNGLIDDVRIYNYARTQKQIIEDMNAGHPAGGSPVGSQLDWWKLDEGYGSSANNKISGRSNISITGADWSLDGKFGKALYFNGTSSDYGSTTVSEIIDIDSQSFTISAWIKTESSTTSEGIIVAKTGWHSGLISPYGTSVALQLWNTTLTWHASSAAINLGVWYHVAGVYSRSENKMRLYLNGVLKDEDNFTGDIKDYSSTLYLGGYGNSNWNFKGYIDEVKIYNYALSEDEIKAEYNRGAAMVLGSLSDTSGLSGGSVASNSASAEYCVPGDTSYCTPPVAEWKFDEKQGQYAYDTSGNSNTGTLGSGSSSDSSDPTWVSGKYGGALKFDGSNDYIPITINVPETEYTYEAWFKTTDSSGTILAAVNPVSPTADYYDRQFGIFQNGKFCHRVWADETYCSTSTYNDNKWHFATVTVGSGGGKLYVDGVMVGTGIKTGSDASGQTGIVIGYHSAWGAFGGLIDQIKIYNYVRSPSQIAWDYNRGKPVGWWKFDECQGTTAYDASGNGNHGTITIGGSGSQTSAGTCTSGNSTDAWYNGATGKFNSSLNFDGTDDYIDLGNSDTLDLTTQFTLSAWIYRNTDSGTYERIIAKTNKDYSGIKDWSYFLQIGNTDKVQVGCGTSSSDNTYLSSNSNINTGIWYHLVGIKTSTEFRIYINGKLDSSGISEGSMADCQDNDWNTYIGRLGLGGTWYYDFNGQIDDVRIYNYALTPLQVKQLYNEGAAVRFGPDSGSP